MKWFGHNLRQLEQKVQMHRIHDIVDGRHDIVDGRHGIVDGRHDIVGSSRERLLSIWG